MDLSEIRERVEGATDEDRYTISEHGGYENDGVSDCEVWDDESNFPEPVYVGLDRADCERWIKSALQSQASGREG